MNILRFKDVDEVVKRGNQTFFGLAARCGRATLARPTDWPRAAGGTVWVNCYDVFDARGPVRRLQDEVSAGNSVKYAAAVVHRGQDGVCQPCVKRLMLRVGGTAEVPTPLMVDYFPTCPQSRRRVRSRLKRGATPR